MKSTHKSALPLNVIIIAVLILIFLVLSLIIGSKFFKEGEKIKVENNKDVLNKFYVEQNKEEINKILFDLQTKKDFFKKLEKFLNTNEKILKDIVNNEVDFELLKEASSKANVKLPFLVFLYKYYYIEGCNFCYCGIYLDKNKAETAIKHFNLNLEEIKCNNNCGSYSWQIEGCENTEKSKEENFLLTAYYLRFLLNQIPGDELNKYALLLPSFLEEKPIKKNCEEDLDKLINILVNEEENNNVPVLKEYSKFVNFVYFVS